MNTLLERMYGLYQLETNHDSKLTLATMMHSIASKKFPLEYKELKDNLNISHNIEFSDKSYFFMNNIDSFKYVDNLLIISKDDKQLRLPIIDVMSFFNKKNGEMSELNSFFIKSFFVEPANFDKFQISQFLLSIEG